MKLAKRLALTALVAGLFAAADPVGPAAAADDANKAKLAEKAKRKALKDAIAAQAAAPAKPAPATQAQAPVAPKPAPRPTGKLDPAAVAKLIDTHVGKKIADAKLTPSPVCTDEEFLRRAYLDVTGVVPTAAQARAFLDTAAPDKRARLIDELLASPNFGRRLADYWQAKLYQKDSNNRFITAEPLVKWMTEQFNANTPWDTFVTKLLTATGTVEENPEVTFFLSNRVIDKITDHVVTHFMGVQLQCAQCHNHPFVKEWKQTDYWGVAGYFSKVKVDRPGRPAKGADNTKIGVVEGATKTKTKDFFPEAAKDVPPKPFLAAAPALKASEPYRPALAAWLTSAQNPFFSKALVNRTWALMFGAGIVNPVEDMSDLNEPSHPELLAALAQQFAAGGFDLKGLYKGIALSQAYQRSSRPVNGNEKGDDAHLFAHQAVKVMTPEQLYDSLEVVLAPAKGKAADGPKKGQNQGQKGNGGGPRGQFVEFFLAGAEEANPSQYDAGIPQALRLMNGKAVANPQALAKALAPAGAAPAQVIEAIYLTALSRRPTAAETARLTAYAAKASTPAEGYGDIVWAVMNSSEFTMVR